LAEPSNKRYNYYALKDADDNVRRWYENIERSSPTNADKSLQRLGYICRRFSTTPAKMATMNSKAGANLIFDVLAKLDKEGAQPSYMRDYVKVLKSWFSHNETQVMQRFKMPRRKKPTKASTEEVPTPDKFRRILNAADFKQKVECTLVGLAGLRPETIGNYRGDDGLVISDFPEMEVLNGNKEVRFKKVPTMLVIRENLSKTGLQYFTFYQDEGCQYLKELLEFRMNKRNETITKDTPIVVPTFHNKPVYDSKPSNKGKNIVVKWIRTNNIGDSMRSAIREAGFDYRPYILRSYFDTRMMMAEADGYIIKDWRKFWMGHTGDIEHTYTLNKGRLPQDLLNQMRNAFEKASTKYLATTMSRDAELTEDKIAAQWHRQMLEIAGFPPEEIDKLGDLGKFTSAEIGELLNDKTKKGLGLNGATTQKVVPLDEVERYIVEGWEYVRDLPPNKAIIRLPKHQ
jgi:hypothetical protein